MATTPFERVSDADALGAPWESSSISTWTDGRIALVCTVAAEAEGPATPPWPTTRTLTGNGQTWTEIATVTTVNGSDEAIRMSLFEAILSSPSTGVLTAGGTGSPSPAGVLFKGMEVSEYGTGRVGSPVTGSGTGTSAGVTLPSFADATNNLTICWCAFINGFGAKTVNISFDGSLSELGADIDPGFDVSVAHATLTGEDTTPSATLSASTAWAFIALELDSDAGGGGGGSSAFRQTVQPSVDAMFPHGIVSMAKSASGLFLPPRKIHRPRLIVPVGIQLQGA